MFLLIPLKFGKSQFLANLVIANAQLLNLFVRHMHFFTGFKIYAVDDAVRVNVFSVNVRADQHLATLEISGKSACCFVRRARVNVHAFRKALHHVVELDAAVLVVQELGAEKLVERRFRLAADSTDELLSIPERFIFLCHIPHHAFHAAA